MDTNKQSHYKSRQNNIKEHLQLHASHIKISTPHTPTTLFNNTASNTQTQETNNTKQHTLHHIHQHKSEQHQQCTNQIKHENIHTTIVNSYLNNYNHNTITNTIPLNIHHSETTLLRTTRYTIAHGIDNNNTHRGSSGELLLYWCGERRQDHSLEVVCTLSPWLAGAQHNLHCYQERGDSLN